MPAQARAVTHVAPRRVEVRDVALPAPGPDEVVVRVEASGLSAGTERLVFTGQLEPDEPLDASLPGLAAGLAYPLRYGYCAVGVVEAVGHEQLAPWRGRRVFAFAPHQSHLVVPAASLVPLPDVPAEVATALANLETAVSLVMDGAPLLGEACGVVGLGVVGHLVASLLGRLGLGAVLAVDPRGDRRDALAGAGVERLDGPRRDACDVVFEVSGSLAGLGSALELARADGRVVVGSWYGKDARPLALGTRVHRARQTVRFSQVSRIAPALAGRFDKARRLRVAVDWLTRLDLSRLVTHRVPAERAAEAFELLLSPPPGCLHTVLTWG
jgi:2-desacetyl-2-hydroxyethyl bacteriochlorophyllide A dehydrogenase